MYQLSRTTLQHHCILSAPIHLSTPSCHRLIHGATCAHAARTNAQHTTMPSPSTSQTPRPLRIPFSSRIVPPATTPSAFIPTTHTNLDHSANTKPRSSPQTTSTPVSSVSSSPVSQPAQPESVPFSQLAGLPSGLLTALTAQGLVQATPIQTAAFPVLLAHHPALIASHTGSGKTLAYLLPIITNLQRDETEGGVRTRLARPRAIVVVPNRELAIQILSVAKSLSGAQGGRFRSLASTGFIPLRKLSRALESPVDLLIVTPGRLEFLLSSNRIWLTDCKYVVMDETDTLLAEEQGFREGIEQTILHGMKHRLAEWEKKMAEVKAQKKKEVQQRAEAQENNLALPDSTTSSSLVSSDPPVQMVFCSASISPKIESYLRTQFPSLVRVHTPSLHHLPRELIIKNVLVGTEDKREVLMNLLEKESASYRQRLMHNRTREQNQRELAALGGDETRWWAEIIRQDMESRTGAGVPSSAAELQIRNQLRYDEAGQDHMPTLTEIVTPPPTKEEEAADRADPDHPDHPSHYQADQADQPATPASPATDKPVKQLPLPPTIIFCNTVSCCRAVAWYLTEQGLQVGHYHGLMPAHYRTMHFKNFLSGTTSILVATDLASRGLDTTFVQHVIHFDFPLQVLDFIHRVGRTARNGRKGKSTALLGKRDRVLSEAIDRLSDRGLSIEQLTGDRSRYGPDGLPLLGPISSRPAPSPSSSTGPKVLPPVRGVPKTQPDGRPKSAPLQRGSEPRRRWMRYLTPTQRNEHKLLYSYRPPGPQRKKYDPKTPRQLRREPETGTTRLDDDEEEPRSDPFAFSAPPQFRGQRHRTEKKSRASSTTYKEDGDSTPKQPQQDVHNLPTKFPSATEAGRRPAPSRPLGPLAHKQRLGPIFARPAEAKKSPIGKTTSSSSGGRVVKTDLATKKKEYNPNSLANRRRVGKEKQRAFNRSNSYANVKQPHKFHAPK